MKSKQSIDSFIHSNRLTLLFIIDRLQATKCRANDYDALSIVNRYVDLIQALCKIPELRKAISQLVEENPIARELRAGLKLRPGTSFFHYHSRINSQSNLLFVLIISRFQFNRRRRK